MPEPTATTKPASTPAPIFTDKNEPHVRIEDIMTFFEPPGTRLPTGQPPSAATYQQQ
jgi:hypothetical protein